MFYMSETYGFNLAAQDRRANCEEATFYLQQCGVKSLDRDGDGIPCASLCRQPH
jgi:hypothetical protein